MNASTSLADRHERMPRLVVFDIEGVLIPKRRYLLFEASKRLSIVRFLKMVWAGFLYEAWLTSLETALRNVYKQLRDLSLEDLFQLYRKMPLMQGAKEVTAQLREKGCKIALISSGLPQSFVEDLSSQLNCDYAFGLDLEVVDGRLTGQIDGDAIKSEGKAMILKRIQEKEGLTPQDCAVVADDRNNLPMYQLCSKKVGYNPDFLLGQRSDAVVKGDLAEVAPIIIGSPTGHHSVSRRDLTRESIHIAGFLVPALTLYLSISHSVVLLTIFIVTLLYIASELARMQGVNVPLLSTITWKAAIQPEIYEFVTAPILLALGIMLTLILFSPPISYASIATLTLGDGAATLLGKTIGRHRIPYNKAKKIEGAVFGFLFAWMGASLFINPFKAMLGSAAGIIMESLPTPINDNLTIPLATGLVLTLLQ